MSAKKKVLRKLKPKKKSKSSVKKSVSQKPASDPANAKGSVTRYLEAKHGKTYTESELIQTLDEDLQDAWSKLRAFAAELGPQRIYASALTIMFAKKVCFFFVRPKKKFIEVWIFLPRKIEGLKAVEGSTKKPKYCNLFKLEHADQIEEPLTDWLREAFEFAP